MAARPRNPETTRPAARVIEADSHSADMPLTGPIPEGGTFFCPHCGALYSVTYSRLSKSDSNIDAACAASARGVDHIRAMKLEPDRAGTGVSGRR
jgi:hypothetical protein